MKDKLELSAVSELMTESLEQVTRGFVEQAKNGIERGDLDITFGYDIERLRKVQRELNTAIEYFIKVK